MLSRRIAVQLLDCLPTFAEGQLAGRADTASYSQKLESTEPLVKRAAPTMTSEDAGDPPSSVYVSSLLTLATGDRLSIGLTLGGNRRRTAGLDLCQTVALAGYIHTLFDVICAVLDGAPGTEAA